MSKLFKQVRQEVERRLNANPNLSFDIVAEEAMNKYRVPSTEGTRESFLHALRENEKKKKGKPESEEIKKEFPKERVGEKQKMFSFEKETMRKIRAGTREVALRESVRDEIKKGGDPESEIGRKKFENLGFIPRR